MANTSNYNQAAQEIDLEAIIADSVRQEPNFDASELQQRIIIAAAALPQDRVREQDSNFTGVLPFLRRLGWPAAMAATAALVVVLSGVLLPESELQMLTEDVFLNAEQLELAEYESLVWPEVMLLEEELAFASL